MIRTCNSSSKYFSVSDRYAIPALQHFPSIHWPVGMLFIASNVMHLLYFNLNRLLVKKTYNHVFSCNVKTFSHLFF